jgi:hypothetical protein
MKNRHSTGGGRRGGGPIRFLALCAGVAGALFLRVEAHGSKAGAAGPGGALRTTRAVLDAAGGAMRGPSAFRIRSASLGSGFQTGVSRGGVRLSSGFLQPSRAAPVPALAGDFNGDGGVDFDDFFLFAAAFGSRERRFDLDGDGGVDFDDFFLFAAAFGQKR